MLKKSKRVGNKKTCTECGKLQPLSYFSPAPRMNDGRSSVCKKCNTRRQQVRRKRLLARTHIDVPAKKWCNACGKMKRAKEFYENRSILDGLASQCIPCALARRRAKLYGLTPQEFSQLIVDHGGKCPICGVAFVGNREPSIDHCHETNAIRGLLCRKCNTGLGRFCDDARLLTRAAKYLKSRRNGWRRP